MSVTFSPVPLVLIRHAPTPWNAARRLQGRSDIALDAAGRAVAAGWRPDPAWRHYRLLASPLARARETAALMFPGAAIEVEPRLIEMDFGAWEGKTLQDLRGAAGSDAAQRETLGLDFRAPEGESPREVQARIRPLLGELAAAGHPAIAVTHKAVLRAVYALATGWQMREKPPQKLRDACAHLFLLDAAGRPTVAHLNLPLADAGRAP